MKTAKNISSMTSHTNKGVHVCPWPGACSLLYDRGAATSYRPRVVLEDLTRVWQEARPELRSLHISGGRIRHTGASLRSGRDVGRRHVGSDAAEADRCIWGRSEM